MTCRMYFHVYLAISFQFTEREGEKRRTICANETSRHHHTNKVISDEKEVCAVPNDVDLFAVDVLFCYC